MNCSMILPIESKKKKYLPFGYILVAPDTLAENAVCPITFVISMFAALKGSQFYFHLLLLQLVLCRVAALKSLPVHHP